MWGAPLLGWSGNLQTITSRGKTANELSLQNDPFFTKSDGAED